MAGCDAGCGPWFALVHDDVTREYDWLLQPAGTVSHGADWLQIASSAHLSGPRVGGLAGSPKAGRRFDSCREHCRGHQFRGGFRPFWAISG